MRIAISALVLLAELASCVFGQEPCAVRSKAKAFLELEACVKARSATVGEELAHVRASDMLASLAHDILPVERPLPAEQAARMSAAAGNEVFLWVGGCKDDLKQLFPDADHWHLTQSQGDKSKRLILPRADADYYWHESELTAAGLKKFMGVGAALEVARPAPSRPAVKDEDGGCADGSCAGSSWGRRRR